jgi:hypothetical protein
MPSNLSGDKFPFINARDARDASEPCEFLTIKSKSRHSSEEVP